MLTFELLMRYFIRINPSPTKAMCKRCQIKCRISNLLERALQLFAGLLGEVSLAFGLRHSAVFNNVYLSCSKNILTSSKP